MSNAGVVLSEVFVRMMQDCIPPLRSWNVAEGNLPLIMHVLPPRQSSSPIFLTHLPRKLRSHLNFLSRVFTSLLKVLSCHFAKMNIPLRCSNILAKRRSSLLKLDFKKICKSFPRIFCLASEKYFNLLSTKRYHKSYIGNRRCRYQ